MRFSRMLRLLVALAVLAMPAGPYAPRALAQAAASPESLQAANELFELLSKDMFNQMTTQMSAQFWPLFEAKLRGKADAATLADLRKEFEKIQLENLGDVLKDAPPIYARNFTAAELHEITAFYKTPTGQKTLRVLPVVMAEFVQGLMPRMQDVQTKAQQRFEKILRDRGYIK